MESFDEHYQSMCATVLNCMPGADMTLIERAVRYAEDTADSVAENVAY